MINTQKIHFIGIKCTKENRLTSCLIKWSIEEGPYKEVVQRPTPPLEKGEIMNHVKKAWISLGFLAVTLIVNTLGALGYINGLSQT